MFPLIVSLLSLVLVVVLLSKWVTAWLRLRHLPGPFWASFSNLWLAWHARRGTLPWAIKEATDKYGPLVRVGISTVVNSNPETVTKILQPRSRFIRAPDYQAARFRPGVDNILSIRDEDAHKALKAKTSAGYTGKEVDGLEHEIEAVLGELTGLIERKYLSTASDYRPVDFTRLTQYFTLDVIMAVAFGMRSAHLTSDSDIHGYLAMSEKFMPVVAIVLVYPWICNIMESRFLSWMGPNDTDESGMGKIMGLTKEVVSERFGPNKKVGRDMLGSFIAHGMTQDEANSETLVQIVAGSDTTATTIRVTLLHIIASPHVYARLRKEIDSTEAAASGTIITDAEARKLPYLQAVIIEGIRYWPPIGLLASKIVPKGGATINDFFLPEGISIGQSIMGIERSKEIFGEDADQYCPERWLNFGDSTEEKARERKMRSTVDLVFASGKYTCPGRPVAMIELNKIYVELLRRYDITLVNPSRPWTSFYAGVWLQKGLMVRITKRGDTSQAPVSEVKALEV